MRGEWNIGARISRNCEKERNVIKEDVDLLNYIVVCISEFANKYEMHMREAYIYLS